MVHPTGTVPTMIYRYGTGQGACEEATLGEIATEFTMERADAEERLDLPVEDEDDDLDEDDEDGDEDDEDE